VRQPVEQFALLHQLLERFRLGEVERRRLVAQHVKAIFQRQLCRREMHVVRRDDRDEVHAFVRRQLRFLLDHLLEAAVTALGVQEKILAAGPRLLRIGREGAADEFDLLVHGRSDPVDRTDEGPASAAHHSVTNLSAHKRYVSCKLKLLSGDARFIACPLVAGQ
jgi:hypothetical protein